MYTYRWALSSIENEKQKHSETDMVSWSCWCVQINTPVTSIIRSIEEKTQNTKHKIDVFKERQRKKKTSNIYGSNTIAMAQQHQQIAE